MNLGALYAALTALGFKRGGGGGGAVSSVNTKTGAVVLGALDLGAIPQISGNYNAATNTVTSGPLTGTHLVSSTVPAGSTPPHFAVTVGGTPGLDAVGTLKPGDSLYQTGTVWAAISGVGPGTAMQRANGSNGLTDAKNGVDYGAPLIFQCGIEVLRAPSGTIGNNGALTLTTALQNILSDGCWMEFPVGAIASGLPAVAGTKNWVVMSSATVGVIFAETYIPGTSGITKPASPTPLVTTGPGAYVNATATTTAYQFTIPANTMGANGSIDYEIWARSNNNGNAKTVTALFGASAAGVSISMTTAQQNGAAGNVMNKNDAKKQKSCQLGKFFNGNGSTSLSTIDTTVDQVFKINFNTAVAGDWVCVDSLRVSVTGAP